MLKPAAPRPEEMLSHPQKLPLRIAPYEKHLSLRGVLRRSNLLEPASATKWEIATLTAFARNDSLGHPTWFVTVCCNGTFIRNRRARGLLHIACGL
jgi:hypothetical protein